MHNKRLIIAAFGYPLSERIFSGIPRRLFLTFSENKYLTDYLSTRQIKPNDIFRGAIDIKRLIQKRKLSLSPSWIWQRKTVDLFTQRFNHRLAKFERGQTILQIGTHVRIEQAGYTHYCFTDMTVIQAVHSKYFLSGKLNKQQIDEAVEVQKDIFNNCAAIFASSHWVKESIVHDYGISANRVHTVGFGASVDEALCDQHAHGGYNILFIGKDWHRKGGSLLIEAFKKVRKAIPTTTLSIIGAAPAVNEDGAHVLGYLNKESASQNQKFNDAIKKAAILCVPSDFEPFGICFAESQLYGVTPVTFAGEGRSDVIVDGVTGMLVKERTSDSLANVLIALLNDQDRIKQMGRAGREYVKNNYTWNRVAEKILSAILIS